MTKMSKYEGKYEEIEEAEKEEEIDTAVEFGDGSDNFKDVDICIGNKDTKT